MFIFISTELSVLPLSDSKREISLQPRMLDKRGPSWIGITAPDLCSPPGLWGRTCGKATLTGSSRVKAKVCVFSRMCVCLPSRQNTRPGQEMGALVPPVRGNGAADEMTANEAGRTSERQRWVDTEGVMTWIVLCLTKQRNEHRLFLQPQSV